MLNISPNKSFFIFPNRKNEKDAYEKNKNHNQYLSYLEIFKPKKINYDQKNCNLNHYFKKGFYDKSSINRIVERLNDTDCYVGHLPNDWFFENDEISKKTLLIGEIFSNFASAMYGPAYKDKKELQIAAKALSDTLEKYLEMPVKAKYYREGKVGKVFLIKINKKIYALKIYHNYLRNDLKDGHGVNKEVANAIYANRTLKKEQCTKFYFGKFKNNSKNDCFMLTKFIEEDPEKYNYYNHKNSKDECFKFRRINFEDISRSNVINNTLVDFGGIDYSYYTFEQKEIAKELIPLLKKSDFEGVVELEKKYTKSADFKKLLLIYMLYIEDGNFKDKLQTIVRH